MTLKDIAKEAGVSTMMVSRVINQKYNQVSKKNIEKITEIIEKYNYVPNSSARSLSSNSSRIISVFFHNHENPLNQPYNSVMLGYIMQYVQEHGYKVMVHAISDYSQVNTCIQSWKSEGAIFLGSDENDIERMGDSYSIPLVFTDNQSMNHRLINIGVNDYKGGELAASHLIEENHKQFAFWDPFAYQSQVIKNRLQGFKETLCHHGYSLDPTKILIDSTAASVVDRLTFMTPRPTAIFVPTDLQAIKLMHELLKRGYQIPHDFSIVGFDNLPISELVYPPLTTIAQDFNKKALYAVNALFHHIKEPELPAENMILDVTLIKRQSS